MEGKTEIMWAIIGNYGLYCGMSITRKDMIREHCKSYLLGPAYTSKQIQKQWHKCKKHGDRAIKVKVTPILRDPAVDFEE